ncbi:MAG: O-antigen ligase family protein [Candidatus Pelagibacter sp.]
MKVTIPEKYNFFKDYNIIFILFFSFCLGNIFINLATLICFVIFIIKFKEIKIYINQLNNLFYLFLLFWFILVLSTIINDHKNFNSIFKSVSYLRFIILPFVIVYMIAKVDKKKFVIFINFLIILLIFDVFFQFYFKFDIFGYNLKDLGNPRQDRIGGFFGDEFVAGGYLSLFGFLSLFLVSETKIFEEKKYLYIIYLSALLTAIIITGDRVSIILIFGIFLFNLIFNTNLRKYFLASLLLFSFLGVLVIQSSNKLSYRYIDNINDIAEINIFKEPSTIGFLNTPWISHYLVSIEMIKEKPILGFGNKGFRKFCPEYYHKEKLSKYKHKCANHPHNTYFEIAIDTGILGLVIFIIFNLVIFFKVLKNKNTLTLLIYSIIFTIINPIRPSGSFFSTWSAATYWVIIGVLLYFLIKNYSKKTTFSNN